MLEKVLSSNDRVAAVVDAGVEKATEHKFKLIELIKLPMQRILRNVLLISVSEMDDLMRDPSTVWSARTDRFWSVYPWV